MANKAFLFQTFKNNKTMKSVTYDPIENSVPTTYKCGIPYMNVHEVVVLCTSTGPSLSGVVIASPSVDSIGSVITEINGKATEFVEYHGSITLVN